MSRVTVERFLCAMGLAASVCAAGSSLAQPAVDAAAPVASASASADGGTSTDASVPGATDASADGSRDANADADTQRDATTAADAGVASDTGATDLDAGKIWASCMPHLPDGVTAPTLKEDFPARGLVGYALPLRVTVHHGRGEKVLPNGFRIQNDSDAARALATAGFILPDPDGGSGPSLSRKEAADETSSEIVIHFVALPDEPGRHELELPPIPIAVSRASGEMMTLCTTPHKIVLDEPTANEPHAKPEPNPPPRRQRELWTLARDLTYGAIVGAIVAALVAWLILYLRRRPKPTPPPPPPRPPWEIAFEELEAIRRLNLVADGQLAEHVDRVSDTVRRYLGTRYGFDGIESTTDEALRALRRVTPPIPVFDDVRKLLTECDLVKFARMTPTQQDCEDVLGEAEAIVRSTMPALHLEPDAPPAQPPLGESPAAEVVGEGSADTDAAAERSNVESEGARAEEEDSPPTADVPGDSPEEEPR